MKSCNDMWRDHKCKTKLNYFEKKKGDPDLANNPPDHIVEDQWSDLVAYWRSEDAKEISNRNSCVREIRGPNHTTGRKPHCQLRYEMRQRGEPTDKMSVWKKARDTTNPDVAEAISMRSYSYRNLRIKETLNRLKIKYFI